MKTKKPKQYQQRVLAAIMDNPGITAAQIQTIHKKSGFQVRMAKKKLKKIGDIFGTDKLAVTLSGAYNAMKNTTGD